MSAPGYNEPGFWGRPDAMEIWHARVDAAKARQALTGKTAMQEACEALALEGAALGRTLRESCADRYERNPMLLDMIPGLAAWSTPEQIIAVCDSHEDNGRIDFVLRSNIAGARLYAQRQIAKRTAEAA